MANDGLSNTTIRTLAIDPKTPTTTYAGTDGGVFKSTNGGRNWSAGDARLASRRVSVLIIDPKTPTTLYVVNGKSVIRSIDAGDTWIEVGGLTDTNILAMVIDPRTPTTVYAGTDRGAFKITGD